MRVIHGKGKMRFYLMKDVQIVLSTETEIDGLLHYGNAKTVQCDLSTQDVLEHELKCRKKLAKLLRDVFVSKKGDIKDQQQDKNEVGNADGVQLEQMSKRLKLSPSPDKAKEIRIFSYIKPVSTRNKPINIRIEGEILKRIQQIFDGESKQVKVELTLKKFAFDLLTQVDTEMGDRSTDWKKLFHFMALSTKPMEIMSASGPANLSYCKARVALPDVLSNYWLQSGNHVSGEFSVEIIFDKLQKFDDHLLRINRNILEKELCPDAVIEANNGVEIKCHKSFILAHEIRAFQAMFAEQNNFQEAQTSKLKMDDVSEEGVRAFLAYFYHWDIDAPSKKCETAFELLHIAQKYGINSLKLAMETILLQKEDDWFTVDVALQLFVLASGMEDGQNLKRVAIWVIKCNRALLKSSEHLKTLLIGNHEMVMEIMECLCDD